MKDRSCLEAKKTNAIDAQRYAKWCLADSISRRFVNLKSETKKLEKGSCDFRFLCLSCPRVELRYKIV